MTYGPTYLTDSLTWVGARDTCVSKKWYTLIHWLMFRWWSHQKLIKGTFLALLGAPHLLFVTEWVPLLNVKTESRILCTMTMNRTRLGPGPGALRKHPKNWETAHGAKRGFIERKALLEGRLHWKKGFIERTALLKERLCWKKSFVEKSFIEKNAF